MGLTEPQFERKHLTWVEGKFYNFSIDIKEGSVRIEHRIYGKFTGDQMSFDEPELAHLKELVDNALRTYDR